MSFDAIRQKLRQMRAAQDAALGLAEQLSKTPIGKLAIEVSGVARSRTATQDTADRLKRQLDSLTAGASREAVAKTSVARQIAEIERYAANESGGAWGYLKRKLGPVADAIKSLLHPRGQSRTKDDVQAAAELLTALGATTDGAIGRRVTVQTSDQGTRTKAEGVLRSLGFDVQAPSGREKTAPPVQWPVDDDGLISKPLGGQFVRFEPHDPILTGEMIPVSSSNVHSIGYIWSDKHPEKGTLKVQYLDHDENWKKTTDGGPIYLYHDVPPRIFIAFQRAASKGKYVWDNLRIRGTVSGHQYEYELSSLSASGYVPRQATQIGNAEYYVPRSVRVMPGGTHIYQGRPEGSITIKSKLKQQMVRQLTPRNGKPSDPRNGSR